MSKTLLAALLLTPCIAAAAPLELTHQGRIFDASGVALDQPSDLGFALYTAASGGTPVWVENRSQVPIEGGYYAVTLGQITPLSAELFSGDTLFLAVVVDGSELGSRQPVVSVPYAIQASTSQNVEGGVADVTEVRINGNTVIDADGLALEVSWDNLSDVPGDGATLGSLTCGDEELAVYQGGSWTCASAASLSEHTHDAAAVVSGRLDAERLPADALPNLGCSTGQLAAYLSSGWTCVLPTDLGLSASDVGAAPEPSQCPDGELLGWDGSSWQCSAPLDIGLSPTASTCDDGSLLFWNGAAWDCDDAGALGVTAADVGALPAGGGVSVGDESSTCDSNTEGTLRYDSGALQLCDGTDWVHVQVSSAADGSTANRASEDCAAVQAARPNAPDGRYWIDPDGSGSLQPFQAWCDMTRDGGGWTLVYRYGFTNYNTFQANDNAVTPRPSWNAASADVPVSTTPPADEETSGAIDFVLWQSIGEAFMVVSNINHEIICEPGTGSLVESRNGTISCRNLKNVAPTCSDTVPTQVARNANGHYLSASSLYYYWDGNLNGNWPTHDPCGLNRANQKTGESDPYGAIYIR